jgi:enamine deaminase RidA (YjgF/YER057c/UK114 family)
MNSVKRFPTFLSVVAVSALLAGCAGTTNVNANNGAQLLRVKNPGSTFPILQAVEVPAGYKTIYLSGMGPDVADKSKPAQTIEAYGNTETQTASTLRKIDAALKGLNLSMSDVIKMQVFLVGDPQLQGKLDFKGMMAAYTQFFGTTEQPNLPTRSALQVAALANPGWLVEIEVVAAVPGK